MQPDATTRTPRAASRPEGEPRWQVRLLGAVQASDGVQVLERFPSRAVAVLLARLAQAPDRAHSREELVELLWPGVALGVGRNRLRQVLSTLKSLLEPAGTPAAPVLQADRLSLRAVPGALACDALQFERHVRAGRAAEAAALYRGEFMPGFYDEWVGDERQRLAALHDRLALPAPLPEARAVAAAMRAAPAPADAGAAATAPLPSYLTRLFGAERSEARLRGLVRTRRLVTLTGPGGSGKTRLAVETAQALREQPAWPTDAAVAPFDRIVFVSLVLCEDALQLGQAVARALHLPGSTEDRPGQLVAALAGQRVLLVLDNFEQLVGRAEAAVADWLARLPWLHLLVTSRRTLGLDGECAVVAEPLAPPPADATPAAAAANAAVALFVDRARAVRADFHLGERNHAAIVALVRALHGMPLAIELAASRVRSIPPSEMVAMLTAPDAGGAHLALLARSGPRAGHDPRHASMTQVIAWSWRLLDAPAQQVLGALTLFAGDATVAALAGVLGLGRAELAAQLDDLVTHSLVRVLPADESTAAAPAAAPRFGLVEPVHEFVATRLAPEQARALRAALRHGLLAWARALGPTPLPARVAPELRCVHAALAAAVADGAPQDAVALALALRSYWDTDALPAHLQDVLEQALQQCLQTEPQAEPQAAPGAWRADLHELLAYLRFESGFVPQARAHAEAALAAAGNDPSRRARALVRRAWVELAANRSPDDAGPEHQWLSSGLAQALQLARGCDDREAQARALHQQAVLASHVQGDWLAAEALLAESQALWQALGDRRKVNARQRNRAQCWLQLGRRDEAQASFEHCERMAREDGDWVGQIDSQLSLATLLTSRRQWAAALEVSRRSVALSWQRWHRHGLGYALWNLPQLLARLRQPEPALLLMGFAATFWATSFGPLSRTDRQHVRRVQALARVQLGAPRAQQLWAEGSTMDVARAVNLALNG